jgi:hypothetical protein
MEDEKPPQVDTAMVATRICCARATVHIVRVSPPIAGIVGDENGVELGLAFGSSVEGMQKADTVALLDANEHLVSAAPIDRVPEIRNALHALASAMMKMYGQTEFRTPPMPARPSDGIKH